MTEDSESTQAEKREAAWRDLVTKLAELGVHFGLFNSVMGQFPEHVQENFLERMQRTTAEVDVWIGEIQEFASAFDD